MSEGRVEKVIYFGCSPDGKEDPVGEYDRLYFGAEFCQRRIPDTVSLEKVLRLCDSENKEFTLVTPFVTDEGLEKLKGLFDVLGARSEAAEVVVNDWGVARYLSNSHPSFRLCLGRLLNKQKRGPRITLLKERLPGDAFHHFTLPMGESVFATDLAECYNFGRIELDNLLQGVNRNRKEVPASLYYPFACVSTTRYCYTAMASGGQDFRRSVETPCSEECLRYTFRLKAKEMPVPLYLRGGTQFYRNDELPGDLPATGIDRLVFEPYPPV